MLSKIPDNSARPLLEEVQRLQDSLFLGLIGLPAAHAWTDNRELAAWVEKLPDWVFIPQLVANRFIAHNSVWARHAVAIAAAATVTKGEMHRVWESHRKAKELYTDGGTHTLAMPDWTTSPAWEALRDLMESFYGAALGDSDFPLSHGRIINRARYIAGFASLAVCPYWDCGLVRGEAELDHFLPVSLFPFLSVCPDNLVPVSHGPNRRGHKGNRVALDQAQASQTHRSAKEWFHPRWASAEGKLEAIVSRAPAKDFSVQVQATSARWQAQVSNYDGLVDLSCYWTEETNARWRDDLTSLGQEMNRYHAPASAVLQGRLDDLMYAEPSRPFTLLHRGKFAFSLRDISIIKEIEEQSSELRKRLRQN